MRKSHSSVKRANPFVRFLRWLFPWKGDRAGTVIFKLLFWVFLIIFIVCGWMLLQYYLEDSTASDEYDQARQLIGYDVPSDDPEAEEIVLPARYRKAFGALYGVNQDFRGWVTIDGTPIDYPVVQGTDNDHYLHYTFYNTYNPAGTPFLDAGCSVVPEEMSDNLIIYSHNLNSGKMFHDLIHYKDVAYYKEHPIVHFDTVYEDMDWKIIGFFFTDADPDAEHALVYHHFIDRSSDEEFYTILNEAMQRSFFTTGVDVRPDDKLLMLSTCDNDFADSRVVLLARRVRPGEDSEVDVSEARQNASQFLPHSYIARFGGTYRSYDPNYVYYSPEEE